MPGLSGAIPSLEFEGPQGFFYSTKEVPIDSLAEAYVEILAEANRRGLTVEMLIAVDNERKNRENKK
jgi:hypothetical protein